jgi:ATP-dependent Clp protease ATP-binding subunit ClpB
LLVGPTGTGKSESFTCACDYVFGAGRVTTFDLSEYQDETAVSRFLGESRSDPGLLGLALAETRTGGFLFDEIEKAHSRVLDLFLKMLWRGCVTDATGRTHHLAEFVIGFTSNLGAADVMRMEHASLASTTQAILRRVGEGLRPELLGRIDETLVFTRLSPAVQREICLLEVAKETERLRGIGYDLEVSEPAIEFLVRHGFSSRFGARTLRKTVERSLQEAVVRALFSAGVARGTVRPTRSGKQLDL